MSSSTRRGQPPKTKLLIWEWWYLIGLDPWRLIPLRCGLHRTDRIGTRLHLTEGQGGNGRGHGAGTIAGRASGQNRKAQHSDPAGRPYICPNGGPCRDAEKKLTVIAERLEGPWSAPRHRAGTAGFPEGSLRTATGEGGLVVAQFDDGISHEETSLYKKHGHPPEYWY